MANATIINGRTIQVTLDGSTDWVWDSATEKAQAPELNELAIGDRIWVKSISFRPGATDDKIIVREGSLSGAGMFSHIAATAYDTKTQEYYESRFKIDLYKAFQIIQFNLYKITEKKCLSIKL